MAKKPPATRRLTTAIFLLYIFIILFLLILPNSYRGHNVHVGGLTWQRWAAYVKNSINIVPFHSLSQQIDSILTGHDTARIIFYLIGNFIGFAPLGFFLPTLYARQRSFPIYLLSVLSAITLLELVQVATMRGSFDVDDILLNSAGACVAFWILRHQRIA